MPLGKILVFTVYLSFTSRRSPEPKLLANGLSAAGCTNVMVFSRLNASRENVKPWGSEYIKIDRVRGWQNVYARCTRKLSEIGRISKRPPQINGADNVSRVVELVTYLTRWRRFDGEKIEENITCAICSALLPPDGLWIECDFCRIPPKLQQQLYVVNWMALTSKSPPHLICRELKNIHKCFWPHSNSNYG